MKKKNLTIGVLAKETASTPQTIRHYEKIGLIQSVKRSDGNHRIYDDTDVSRLKFIRHARSLGFSLDSIRDLLVLADEPTLPCDTANEIAQKHLEAVVNRIAQLKTLKKELERVVTSCSGNTASECLVLKHLADHDFCIASSHHVDDGFSSS